jgi:hypothetical protein
MMTRRLSLSRLAGCAVACATIAISAAWASGNPTTSQGSTDQVESGDPFRLEQLLPPSIAQNTDINAWGWFSYLRDSNEDESSYWEGDIALGITQRFGDRLAGTVTMHYLDDNNEQSGFLEQAYLTAVISEKTQMLLTVGKFNASFGIEPRDEWDRLTGTTSLLFGAQPQDLVGAMITQPIGTIGLKIKPFFTTQFDGYSTFDGPPSGGVVLEYSPSDTLQFTLTNWIGPGVSPEPDPDRDEYTNSDNYGDSSDDDEYSYAADEYALDNWGGPELNGIPHGLLYFVDANIRWNPRPDVTLAAEGLFATNGRSADRAAWTGFMFLANYDLTDRWRVFGRWSYLNDLQGLVTGVDEVHQELSVGVGFEIISGLEFRGEYRHDFASSGDLDSVSGHMVFSF